MADAKISALTELAETPAAGDFFPIVDTSAGVTKKLAYSNLGGGGQSPYDAIVAASGGTHTTITLALAAGAKSIFVTNGTYTEASFVAVGADTDIIGETRDGVIVDFSTTGYFEVSNHNIRIANLTFKNWHSAGGIQATQTSNDHRYQNLRVVATTSRANRAIQLGFIRRAIIEDCLFINEVAGATTEWIMDVSSYTIALIRNNYFQGNFQSALRINQGSIFRFSNNYCQSTYTSTGSPGMVEVNFEGTLHDCSIENNYLATDSAAVNLRGVKLQNCNQFTIRDNNIAVTESSTGIGIDLISCDDVLIASNFFTSGKNGIQIDSTCTRTQVTGNNLSAITTVPITDSGLQSVVAPDNIGVSAPYIKLQRKMKNTSGGALAAGDVVILKNVAAGDEITTTTTESDNLVFGVASASISNNAYGNIQVLGKLTTLKVDGTVDIAIGDHLTTFTTAGVARKAAASELAFAVALEAYTTNDAAGVIDALLINPTRL